jgi:hypothetical protein
VNPDYPFTGNSNPFIPLAKGAVMSIFNTILQKLGIQKAATPASTPPAVKPAVPSIAKPVAPAAPPPSFRPGQMAPGGPARQEVPYVPPKPAEVPMVDVVSKLDGLAKANSLHLDWKVSINDLMALLGMDHTPEAIKELAVELGCPTSELGDSYKRNVWTHQALLKKIAENGGNIPQNLLH